jgi:hypothetical protein
MLTRKKVATSIYYGGRGSTVVRKWTMEAKSTKTLERIRMRMRLRM